MSRFEKRLEATTRRETAPLGFGLRRARQSTPTMLVVARVEASQVDRALAVAEAGADVLLVRFEDGERQKTVEALKAVEQTLWGAMLDGATAGGWRSLLDAGCDLVAFAADAAPAAVLQPEDLGRILVVDAALSDAEARVIESLPVDAILVMNSESGGGQLSVAKVLALRRLAGLTRKPLLLPAPPPGSEGDLEALRDSGVQALLVEAEPERIATLRQAIAALPPRRKPKERREAMLPPAAGAPAQYEEEEEEEEDE